MPLRKVPRAGASGKAGGQGDASEIGGEAGTSPGPYDVCLDEEGKAAIARALAAGLDDETALLRVLIRRALLEGKPSTQVAYLVNTLASVMKTHHVLTGKVGKQLDEAITAALDAIATEMGAHA